MALDLYRIALGIAIEDDDGTVRGHILSGTGAPGGDTGAEDDAPVGSIYLRTDASASISVVYQKITDTNATADWVQSASKDYVDSLVNGLSWREPALVCDETAYADVTAAETAANVADTVDGVTIAATDRILLTNIANQNLTAAQDETAFDGTGSNGTFSGGTGHAALDVITMSDGSTITVDTEVGGVVTEFTVTTGSTTPIADGGTITQSSTTGTGVSFSITIGTANTTIESPDLNDVYIVSGSTGAWTFTIDPDNAASDGDALLVQQGTCAEQQKVYDGADWIVIASGTGAAELAYIRTFIGKTAAGSELPTYASTNVVVASSNLETAIGALDTAIGDRTYTEDNYVTDGETITASIDALDQAIAANSLNRAVGTTITAATTVDTVLVDDYQAAKWFVAVFDEGDTDQKYATEVFAIHDGTASSDATAVDWNEVSRLRLNGAILGLLIDVVLSGTGAAQTMGLQITSTDTVTVHVTRVDVEI